MPAVPAAPPAAPPAAEPGPGAPLSGAEPPPPPVLTGAGVGPEAAPPVPGAPPAAGAPPGPAGPGAPPTAGHAAVPMNAADPAGPAAPPAGPAAGEADELDESDDAAAADHSPLVKGRYQRIVAAAGIVPDHDLSPHALAVLDWLARQDDAVCSGVVELLQATSRSTARYIENAGS